MSKSPLELLAIVAHNSILLGNTASLDPVKLDHATLRHAWARLTEALRETDAALQAATGVALNKPVEVGRVSELLGERPSLRHNGKSLIENLMERLPDGE